MHVALFTVLFFGIRWKTKQADPVMAELWSQLPAVEQPRVEPPPPPPRVEPKPPPPKPEPTPEPKVEPKPEPKPDIALEQERKKKEEAEKKKRGRKPRRRSRTSSARRKRRSGASGRWRRSAASRTETRKRMQDQLNRELAAAPKAPATAPAVAGDPAALATWQNQIQAKIRSNIILPPDLAGNPQAEFDVALLPTGEVLSVKLARSSGNRTLDDAWERAILKSSPLPRPSKPEIFVRDLRLKFRPSE